MSALKKETSDGRNLDVCFSFRDQDLIAKVYVSREDFNLNDLDLDGPGEGDLAQLRDALEGDEDALADLEIKAREELALWWERNANDGLGDDPPDLRDLRDRDRADDERGINR